MPKPASALATNVDRIVSLSDSRQIKHRSCTQDCQKRDFPPKIFNPICLFIFLGGGELKLKKQLGFSVLGSLFGIFGKIWGTNSFFCNPTWAF